MKPKGFGAQGAVRSQVAQRWRGAAPEHWGAPCRDRGRRQGDSEPEPPP